MFWGLSEALDLYYEYLNAFKNDPVVEQPTVGNHHDHRDDDDDDQQQTPDDNAVPIVEAAMTEGDAVEIIDITGDDLMSTIDLTNTSPRLTPQQAQPKEHKKKETLNILLFGSCDPRHIIQTLAKVYKHRDANPEMPVLHFYVVDASVEQIARNVALLGIALEHPDALLLRNKVHLFMDVYGNTLLRPYSQQYLTAKTKSLLDLLTNDTKLKQLAPFINFDTLRYRERSGMENAFDFWQLREPNAFDVKDSWERRLRASLGSRYDHRDGVFDWDLCMVLKSNEAHQLCSQEYRYWRETGVAFTFPEYEQCFANRTLSCDLRKDGRTITHRGFLGDMKSGPFATFGFKTEDGRMTKSAHGSNDFRATDVTERNLLELFHELQTRTPYVHNMEMSRKYGSVQLQMGKLLAEVDYGGVGDYVWKYDKPWIDVGGVEVTFMSVEALSWLQNPPAEWRKFFDICHVSSMYFQILKDDFIEVMRDRSLLLLETKLWTVETRQVVGDFEKKLKDYAKEKGYKGVINYQALNGKYSVLKFKKNPHVV